MKKLITLKMGLSLLFLRSVTRYLGKDASKLIFLNKQTLEISKDDPFVWTYIYGEDSFEKVIKLGNLRWIKHLYYYGYKPTFNLMNQIACNGHLKVVKWLHDNRTEGCTKCAMDWAAKNGHLKVVKWLHENRTEGCTKWAMDWAASNGHLKVVHFLHENRTEGCTKWAMNWAARNGHTKVIEYLKSIKN